MAYNPFRAFRKHQKGLLAALTVLSMFIFILTGSMSSGWDFFQGIMPLLGFRGGANQVAVLNGKPVSGPELILLQNQRTVANQFMMIALQVGNETATRVTAEEIARSGMDKQTQDQIRMILGYRGLLNEPQLRALFPQFIQNGFQSLEGIRQARLAAQKPEEAALVQKVEEILQRDLLLAQHQGLWFGGTLDGPGLLDFVVWQSEADRLGIKLAESDIDTLANRETQRLLTPEGWGLTFRELRNRYPSINRDFIRHALADEFRVRLAQEAVVGPDPDTGAIRPEPPPPYELWKFYQEQRAESDFVLLSVPADNPEFLKKVPNPTEAELRAFFEANKDREPDPASAKPGFKQPARVRVEWVGVPADSPEFRLAASFALAVSQATAPVAYELALRNSYEYEKYKYPAASWLGRENLVHEASLNRPENVAALVGALAAPPAGDPALGVLTLPALAGVRDARYRAGRVGALVLAGAGGNPIGSVAPLFAATPRSEYQPFEAVRSRLAERLQEDMTRELVQQTVKKIEDYVTAHSPEKTGPRSPEGIASSLANALATGMVPGGAYLAPILLNRAEAARTAPAAGPATSAAAIAAQEQSRAAAAIDAHVRELALRYHLSHGSTERPRDRLDIDEDPGLAPLRKAYAHSQPEGLPGPKPRPFASLFFETTRAPGAKDLFQPRQLPGAEKFVYWKTAEQAPYVPKFEEARARVLARWKLEKAIPLARQEAERIAAEARKAKGDAERNLRDASTRFGRLIELNHVARLVPRQAFVPSRTGGKYFEAYRIPESQVEYPSAEFLDKLLALKEPGDVAVVHDRPETTFYVADLTHRADPFELAFYVDVSQPDGLISAWEQNTQAAKKYRESCVAQLRQRFNLEYDAEKLKSFQSRGAGLDED